MNKEETLRRLSNLESEAKELRAIIEAPTEVNNYEAAKKWLKEYIKQPFKVIHTNGYINYYIDDQWIFQQDLKNKHLWCYYNKVWGVFEKEFSLKYEQIQALHKEVVTEALNCKEFTAFLRCWSSRY